MDYRKADLGEFIIETSSTTTISDSQPKRSAWTTDNANIPANEVLK
jgi:hypothetical protein